MTRSHFEWDDAKDRANQAKHDVPFHLAQLAFSDPHRVIALGIEHSQGEDRFTALAWSMAASLQSGSRTGMNNPHLRRWLLAQRQGYS